ncbi:hypothetical protein BCR33DRAFT_765687 [Rhizoclosmatium globosum]|uniref:G-protein coupled receptors family 1 profile domain-containing protein n=1 Tax=Rhizoclosmatium globosum TaxID=329046 RepID=A0A1Y2CE26_9FUNG|nr:hypothetical protein BCR33DRAFT_765687 [Rhizoclosmatium globosum]|eukprot:ORY45293.1 hypothetical protein BCR33DRAFT_765687 [Rhizoclosmatium globosum]
MDTFHPQSPNAISYFTVAINIISGLGIEVAIHGLVSVCTRLLDPKKRELKVYIIAALLITCNISAIVYIALGLYLQYVAGPSTCRIAGFVNNLTSHILNISFDSVVLSKCYYITNRNKYTLFCIALVFTNRIGWCIADLIRSYAFWDDTYALCLYFQDPNTGLGYNTADIINDAFATITALIVTYLRFSVSSKFIQSMMIRTIVRSILVIAASGWVLYVSLNSTDIVWYYIAWNTQIYVLVRMINLDVLLDSGKIKADTDSAKLDNIVFLE